MNTIFAFGMERAVWVDNRGYKVFSVPAKDSASGKRKHMPVHRFLYEQVYGPIPKGYHIHHKDENKLNNSLNNLEMLSNSDHRRLHNLDNKWGVEHYKGGSVYFVKERQKWRASITQMRKLKHLGYFPTKLEAYQALFAHDPIYWNEERIKTKLSELFVN